MKARRLCQSLDLHRVESLFQYWVERRKNVPCKVFNFLQRSSLVVYIEAHEVAVVSDHGHVSNHESFLKSGMEGSVALAHLADMLVSTEK